MAWFPLHLRNQSSLWKVRKILLLPISRVCLICMLLLCWKGGRHYLPGREDGILSSSDVWTSIRDGASKREENFPLFIVHNKPLCLKCIVVVLRESASEVSFCLLTTFCFCFLRHPAIPDSTTERYVSEKDGGSNSLKGEALSENMSLSSTVPSYTLGNFQWISWKGKKAVTNIKGNLFR